MTFRLFKMLIFTFLFDEQRDRLFWLLVAPSPLPPSTCGSWIWPRLEPGIQSWSPSRVAGSQGLDPLLAAAPRVCHRKVDQKQRSLALDQTLPWEAGIPSGVLPAVPTVPPNHGHYCPCRCIYTWPGILFWGVSCDSICFLSSHVLPCRWGHPLGCPGIAGLVWDFYLLSSK